MPYLAIYIYLMNSNQNNLLPTPSNYGRGLHPGVDSDRLRKKEKERIKIIITLIRKI